MSVFRKRTITAFFFIMMALFASGSVQANETPYSQSSDTSTYIDKNIEGIVQFPVQVKGEDLEYVHLWFKQIFGAFIFAPWDQMSKDPNGAYDKTDITLLAKGLGFTNILAMIIVLIVTYYTIIGGGLNTAAEGQVLGKSWSTPWLTLRTAIGFTLITPLKIVGGSTLSMAQVGVIWLLIIGSNAASLLWYYIIDNMEQGQFVVAENMSDAGTKTVELMNMVACTDYALRTFSYGISQGTVSSSAPRGRDVTTTMNPIFNSSENSVTSGVGLKVFIKDLSTGDRRVVPIMGEPVGNGRDTYFRLSDKNLISTISSAPSSNEVISKIEFGGDKAQCGTVTLTDVDVADDLENTTIGSSGLEEVGATEYKKKAFIEGSKALSDAVIKLIDELIILQHQVSAPIKVESSLLSEGVSSSEDTSDIMSGVIFNKIKNIQADGDLKSCIALGECQSDAAEIYFKRFKAGQEGLKKAINNYRDNLIVNGSESSGSGAKPIVSNAIAETDAVKSLFEKMRHGGWPVAGVFFYEISALSGISQSVVDSIHGSISSSQPEFCSDLEIATNDDDVCMTFQRETLSAYDINGMHLIDLTSAGSLPSDAIGGQILGGCSSTGSCRTSPEQITDRISLMISKGILDTLSGAQDNTDISNLSDSGSGSPSLASPFLTASEIGHKMNFYAQTAVGTGIAVLSFRDYVEGFDDAKNDTVIDVLGALSGYSKTLYALVGLPTAILMNTLTFAGLVLISVSMAALSSGFILAYVVPFMPLMTWIMMMAGYMLTAVESVGAAALAIVLLFTPEGQGISGSRFERALQLVAMAVLRPSFMVLGLLSGLSVSYVAFGMMNTFFFQGAEYLLSGTIFDVFAVLILYVSATYQLCKLMVETMYQMSDLIGEWFAGGVSRQFGESRMADNSEGSLKQLSGQVSQLPDVLAKVQQKSASKSNKSKEDSEYGA